LPHIRSVTQHLLFDVPSFLLSIGIFFRNPWVTVISSEISIIAFYFGLGALISYIIKKIRNNKKSKK